ncbi:MAG: DNA polymerase/3'-5' exonuclease PolX [Bellilinea sp.]|nr:MAG: DNA polymerase/3'-5' exonuclease PolX [Bellilinea sp.]
MNNQQLAGIFERIANLLEINGEVVYKTLAYRRAAESLRSYPREAEELYREGKLTEIPGVGKAIAEKIEELLTTGKLGFLERLEQEVPPTLLELLEIPDVGPKKVALFWKQAGITSLMDLESAARDGHLRHLPGIGEKSEKRILAGIEALRRRSKRMLLGTVRPIGLRWLNWLRGLAGVGEAELAGSLRRWKSTIGDLDLVAAADDPSAVMDAFVHHPDVVRILAHGENKSSIELSNGLNVQLWLQPQEKFGSLLQFVTGSKDHNVRLRELAQRKGFSLSEHGLTTQDGQEHYFSNEKALYQALGLEWIPPELREDRGEIQAALEGRLPDLITLSDLQAELHSHSTWSDGALSILDMARAAKARGLKMLAITDHTHSLGIANGLDAERLREQRKEIDAAQAELGNDFILLQGAEVEIKADGSLDLPDEVLAELDIVIASLHVSLRQPREEITTRLLRAIRNPHVDIIGHPSGRLLPNREGADLDWELILTAACEENVALEINANPSRLDLDEVHARRAVELGILLSINTDAHSPADLELAEYGVSVARRAWVSAAQVLNTRSPTEIRRWLTGHRQKSG